MSDLADLERRRQRRVAAPGGVRDRVVRFLKFALPSAIGILVAYLALAPLGDRREISFILDKDKVDVAEERMRVEAAAYRGRDEKGRPFVVAAKGAVQDSSREPIVEIVGMSARMMFDEGPANLSARRARYDLEAETLSVLGPIVFERADGYRLVTRDVRVDLGAQRMESEGRVAGRLPLGRFSADTLAVDLDDKRAVLAGNARLRVDQGALR
ncbi:MAG: LPS export ABC transporter periplasmic protein LptC [Sphingomonadaceae bacterium]